MSDQEQQLEEFEVLASIYPDEFSRINALDAVPPHWEGQSYGNLFRIDIKPSDTDSKDMHGIASFENQFISTASSHWILFSTSLLVHVDLICAMPPNYPTEVPLLVDIYPKKGLGPDQVQELLSIAERSAAENLGMPSAYSVAMSVQEWLTENNLPGNDGSMYAGK